jgi:hypothetical protein
MSYSLGNEPESAQTLWNFVVPTDPDVNLAALAGQLSNLIPALIPENNAGEPTLA